MKKMPAYNSFFHDKINPVIKRPRRRGSKMPGILRRSIAGENMISEII
jgi:hypothetical protein